MGSGAMGATGGARRRFYPGRLFPEAAPRLGRGGASIAEAGRRRGDRAASLRDERADAVEARRRRSKILPG